MRVPKFLLISPIALALIFGAGCKTSTTQSIPAGSDEVDSDGNRVIEHFFATNGGVFLFYYVPIWSGTAHHPNRTDYELWENQVRPKYIYRMIDTRADFIKAKPTNIVVKEHCSGWLGLGILWKREIHGRADLVARPGDKDKQNEKKEKN